MNQLFGDFSGLQRMPTGNLAAATPLVVAIHGGTYTSAYFDLPGHSLLNRAAINGIPIIAPDRPGYGSTPILPSGESNIPGQARYLTKALKELWRLYGAGTQGIVLIGHSIGGAIAATIASAPDGLPLLGLALSGIGLRTPSEHRPMWGALPDLPRVEMPLSVKDEVMFGPKGSFDAAMPALSHAANAPAVRAELIDIVGSWQDDQVHATLSKVAVPTHYRQAEGDRLWVVNESEVEGFRRALTNAPWVDARMMRGTGHCMDLHHVGRALQLQQLGFALQCASEALERA